mmetsp:Transcript_10074/g.18349  ORF Transcript_10074/g.18349 Transcript_10074/m.18349 type:complete len:92 (-) Transcript_10074:89-364(-)
MHVCMWLLWHLSGTQAVTASYCFAEGAGATNVGGAAAPAGADRRPAEGGRLVRALEVLACILRGGRTAGRCGEGASLPPPFMNLFGSKGFG